MSNSGPSPTPQDSPPARKRQRTESSYPRRRSVTACTVCRGRKSKCDNKRPSCSFCLSIGATCVYEELRSDYSNYDSASLHIINRLDHLEKQMEERFDKLAGQKYTPPADSFEKPSVFPTSHYPIAEGILEWPVFEGLELQLHGRSLALVHQDPPNLTNPSIGPGTQDEQPHSGIVEALRDPFLDFKAIQFAIQDFLRNVHVKNPVLEPTVLTDAANECIRNGLVNSVQTALVLITCALGMISTPYGPSKFEQCAQMSPAESESSRQLASRCFDRGRAILSTQPLTLLSTQCYFFCGVYEMYSIHPVAAWLHFSQASLQMKLHIQSRSFSPDVFQTSEGRLLQRLYWSCMQSECELANELRMTSSGLEDLPFPYAFPHPPDSPTTSPSDPDVKSPESHAELNSWMFYLSETSLRRIGNEIIWTLYDGPPSSWVKDIASVHKQAEQLDQKVVAWMDNLPKDLRIEGSIFESTNELGLHVRTRYIVWRAWIFRPFLYYMIHAPQSELLKHRKNIEPLASSCLDYSMQGINDATHHHRHHGSWYTARVAFGGALILLAAARVNSIAMPQGWEAAVQRAMHTMDRWSGESKNMEASLKIVKKLWDAAQE